MRACLIGAFMAAVLCGCGAKEVAQEIFGGGEWEVRGTIYYDGDKTGTLYLRALSPGDGHALQSKTFSSPQFPLRYSLRVRKDCVVVAYLDVGNDSPNWSLGEGDIIGAYSLPLTEDSPQRTKADFSLDLTLWDFDFEVSDPEGDFAEPGEGAPPQGVYHYPPSDMVSVKFKVGKENLYVCCQVAGQIPAHEVEAEDGNIVKSVGMWISLDLDNNPYSGCISDKGAEALLCYQANLEHGSDSAYFFANPTGIEEPEEQRYSKHLSAVFIYGGREHDFFLVAYPLSEIDFPRNTAIGVYGAVEAESDKWHHFSFDELNRTTWHTPE